MTATGTSRRAVRMEHPGAEVRIDRVDRAEAGPDEVVVKMYLAGVNPLDGYVLAGLIGADAPYPRILGVEGAGECEGQLVVVFGNGVGLRRDGTWTEIAVVPAASVVPVPPGVSLEIAAACGVVGPTAIRVVEDLAAPTTDDRVLVLGASGAMGMAACSLLSSAGVPTWGQTTSEEKAPGVADVGAIPLVAGTPQQLTALLEKVAPPTVVLDSLGGGWSAAMIDALEPHGRLVSYGTSAAPRAEVDVRALYRKSLTWHGHSGIAEPSARSRQAIVRALDAAAAGRLRIPARQPISMDQAQHAVDLVRSHQGMGKVLLDLRG